MILFSYNLSINKSVGSPKRSKSFCSKDFRSYWAGLNSYKTWNVLAGFPTCSRTGLVTALKKVCRGRGFSGKEAPHFRFIHHSRGRLGSWLRWVGLWGEKRRHPRRKWPGDVFSGSWTFSLRKSPEKSDDKEWDSGWTLESLPGTPDEPQVNLRAAQERWASFPEV